MISKTRLYTLVSICLLAGYTWVIFNLVNSNHNEGFSVCLIKNTLGIPCPSCGSTRAVIEFLKGNFTVSIYYNPLGIIILTLMVVLPFWIIADFIKKSSTFYVSYISIENFIRRKKVSVILILLLIINWSWNIYKHL
ncbi:DUF2752 domain-containing protein [Solitalea agri]|uniref:DUF2752 domain-containing protein n=1 Tax=Solitalea TaxID=929509 RepID=UPI00360EEE91